MDPDSEGKHLIHTNVYYIPSEFDEKKHGCGFSEDLNDARYFTDAGKTDASIYGAQVTNAEPVDFANNPSFFQSPEPENEEDDREAILFDEDDNDDEWGYLCTPNSFGSKDSRSRDCSTEEHMNVVRNAADGNFRAVVSRLLQVEGLPVGDENDRKTGWR